MWIWSSKTAGYLGIAALLFLSVVPRSAVGQYPERRITFSAAEEVRPHWGPFGDDIAYLTNDDNLSDNSCCLIAHFNVGLVSANSPGSEELLTVDPTPLPGLSRTVAWAGFSGSLVLDEGEGVREFLKIDPYTSSALPLVRTLTDGSEPGFEQLAFTTTMDLPGLLEISRDGSTVLWSSNTSASPNRVFSAPLSSLKGISAFTPAQLEYDDTDSPVGSYVDASVSPDGTTFVLAHPDLFMSGGKDLFVHQIGGLIGGSTPVQLTFDGPSGVQNIDPEFSPNGSIIAFAKSDGVGGSDIWLYSFEEGFLQITNTPGIMEHHPTWSPDGTQLAFARWDQTGSPNLLPGEQPNVNIYVVNLPVSGGTLSGVEGPEIPLTPDLDITVPPVVIEVGDPSDPNDDSYVIIQVPKYTLSPSALTKNGIPQTAARMAAAKKQKVFYEVEVDSSDGSTRKKKYSKRNEVAFRNLPPGTYHSTYRVRAARARRTKKTSSKTRFSREYRTDFKSTTSPNAVFVRSGLK